MRVIEQMHDHTLITTHIVYLLQHAPLAGLGQPQGLRSMVLQGLPQAFIEAGIDWIIDLHIVERPATSGYAIGEMPHR